MSISSKKLEELSKYTPGRWYFVKHAYGTEPSLTLFSEQRPDVHDMNLLTVSDWDWNKENNLALIAAAPDLLRDLKKARELLSMALEEMMCDDGSEYFNSIDRDIEQSHWCTRCDNSVDRNAPVRISIREFLEGDNDND